MPLLWLFLHLLAMSNEHHQSASLLLLIKRAQCIFPNCKMYLSKLLIVFVPIAICNEHDQSGYCHFFWKEQEGCISHFLKCIFSKMYFSNLYFQNIAMSTTKKGPVTSLGKSSSSVIRISFNFTYLSSLHACH